MCFRFAFWILAVMITATTSWAQSSPNEAKSLVDGIVENAKAWRQIDCLLQQEFIDENPSGPLTSKTEFARYIVDLDKNRWCLIQESKMVATDLISSNKQETLLTQAVVYDGTQTVAATFPKKAVIVKLPFEEFLKQDTGFQDIRNVGWCIFPTPFFPSSNPSSFERVSEGVMAKNTVHPALPWVQV